MQTVLDLQKIATQIRRDVLRMVHGAKSGHPGGALGSADFLVALYFSQMQHQAHPFAMDAKAEDTFTLSNGHLSALYYSVLARSGYFPLSELATFRQIHSRLQGHPTTAEHLPGIRVASGSLGQGISFAIGIAQTKKLNHDKTLSYCLCGDGELQEGQIWEALMYAAAKKVDNIILTIDVNGQQIDGSTDEVLSLGDLSAKFTAFAWQVLICDGNNMEDLLTTLQKAKEKCFQQVPVVILMQTLMGKGVDFMMSGHHWHGKAPNDAQLQEALAQLEETLGDY
jgi:transketolase